MEDKTKIDWASVEKKLEILKEADFKDQYMMKPESAYVYCGLCKQYVIYWCEDTDHCSTYPHDDSRYSG